MTDTPGNDASIIGKLDQNILYFGRVLRKAGIPVGPGKVIEALRAVETVGIWNRMDFYWALHSVFVNRQDQRELFDQAFHIVWRKPDFLKQILQVEMPLIEASQEDKKEASQRVAEALSDKAAPKEGEQEEEQEIEFDASFTYSPDEVLQKIDFDTMTIEEQARAKEAVKDIKLPIELVRTRRFAPLASGSRIDMRSTFRASLRYGGAIIPLRYRARRRRRPPLVVLCDISGSMSSYSRMFLHFVHALTNDQDRVHTFLFGTRLTNVTRMLRHRDVDIALSKILESVEDWSGGTRIGKVLHDFNSVWSRRVLGQGALVLLMSDGLDRDAGDGLEIEIERLHKSCRRLIWLNPLLRFDEFEAKSSGVKVIIRHVSDFRPVHNLQTLHDLAEALSQEWEPHGKISDYLPTDAAA